MADDANDANEPAVRGEAAWKAERTATEQRNNAAKERARAHKTANSLAVSARERRMDLLETAELAELNKKLRAPRAQS
jgi:hypothetical protein